MKNISNFINEKLKVSTNIRELPTWKEFVDALNDFPGKVVDLANFCRDLEDAEIKDYPTFVNGGKRYPKTGHIMELHADYETSRNQSIIIFFKYERVPDNFITVRMYAKDYEILIDSLGADLYEKIYNEMKEYYKN